MVEYRKKLRAESQEAYEVQRFKEFLERLANPYLKQYPKKPVDVIKFTWELKRRQPLEEMKAAMHAIAKVNFGGAKVEIVDKRPPRLPIQQKGNKKKLKMKRTK